MKSYKPEEILKKDNRSKPSKKRLRIKSNGKSRTGPILVGLSILTIGLLIFTFSKSDKNIDLKPHQPEVVQTVVKKTYAVAINIDGKDEVYVQDKKAAKLILDEVSKANLPTGKNLKVKNTYFKQKVTTLLALVDAKTIKTSKNAVNYLLYGTATVQKYVLKDNDTLWGIARKNNMHVKDIMAANPSIEADKLQGGMTILLNRTKPRLTVVSVLQGERTRNIPFDTEIVKDKKASVGEDRVITEGEFGKKVFDYEITAVNGYVTDKKILSERVAEKPVNKVLATRILNRPRLVIASRDGEEGGKFMWPKNGHINSPYGYRGREFHTGIDIGGDTGDSVVAAGSGKVVMAGWDGNYGKCILIEHDDGVVTRYAHLSAISVSEGENVGRGDYIGALGATGRSTGPHLHFEVIIGGETRSPLRYLN